MSEQQQDTSDGRDDQPGAEKAGAADEAPAAKPSPLKNPVVRVALLAGVVIVVVTGVLMFIHHKARGQYYQDTNDAYVRADAVTVSPKVSGYVEQLFVGDNQDVKAGQPLLKIDPRDYRAQAAQYQAQIDVSRANADNFRATVHEQLATIDQARSQLVAAQSKAQFDASEAARYAPLAASGAESREKYAQLRAMAVQSANDAASQRAAVSIAQRRIGSLQAQIRQARAQGEGAQAQLTAANVNVGATIIKAATAGRVGDKTVTVGQFAQQGTRLMSIVPLQNLYIEANFKETQLGLMRPGQPVTIKVDALSGVELRGRVASVSPGTGAQFSLIPPENATGNFTKIVQRVPVRISLEAGPETRKLLVPGLSASVTVDTLSAKDDRQRIEDEQKRLDRQER